MSTVRDRFWIWGHLGGAHNDEWNLPSPSRMTPVEGAYYLGVPNLLMIVYRGKPEPPFDREAVAMRPLRRVVWSIVGDSSSKRNDEKSDLDEMLALAAKEPNVAGAMMDDFFHGVGSAGAEGEKVGRYDPAALAEFRRRLHTGPRPLDLWVVLYSHQLDLAFDRHIEHCDVVTFWTWKSADLANLEASFGKFVERTPKKRRVLGCYLWDYGAKAPMPVDRMEHQCTLGLKWLQEGKIDGMIFLSNCVADLDLPAVEWTRAWIARIGDTTLSPALDL